MKNIKKIIAAVIFSTAFVTSGLADQYPVLSKHIKGCYKNQRCSDVSRELCTYQTPDGPIVGVCIDCSGAGYTKCPNSIVYIPGANSDPVDVSQGNFLLDYAIKQIDLNGNLVGVHQITVSVQGESELRIYKVEWDFSESNTETDSGEITVERLN